MVASFFGGGEGDAGETSAGSLPTNPVVYSRPTSAGKFPWLNKSSSRFSDGNVEGGKDHIQVSVRVRPMVQQEISQQEVCACLRFSNAFLIAKLQNQLDSCMDLGQNLSHPDSIGESIYSEV